MHSVGFHHHVFLNHRFNYHDGIGGVHDVE